VVQDQRERANLRHKHPEVFEQLKTLWGQWNQTQLPITDEVFTHGVTPDIQADRYAPDKGQRVRA